MPNKFFIVCLIVMIQVLPVMSMEFKFIKGELTSGTTYKIKTCKGTYSLNSAGKIFNKGTVVSTLPIDTDYRIQYLYYASDSSMTLIVCAISSIDIDDNSGIVFCLDSMVNGLRWKSDIYYMDLCEPLVIKERNALYVSAYSFIGKISIENGSYYWKQTDLKSKNDYMGFYQPVVNKDTVIFKEKSQYSAQPRIIKAYDSTGEIFESAP